jgi:L-fuconate dehydratase
MDLKPEELIRAIGLRYLDDVPAAEEAETMLRGSECTRSKWETARKSGNPDYNTSVGWMAFDDDQVKELTPRAFQQGFRAFKLEVESADEARELLRAVMLHDSIGNSGVLMFSFNLQWNMPHAEHIYPELAAFRWLWIDERANSDDLSARAEPTRRIAPVRIARGEQILNRVLLENLLRYGEVHRVQGDCAHLARVSEFLTVIVTAIQFDRPVAPEVGDIGQFHRHLVLFNQVALNHENNILDVYSTSRDRVIFSAQRDSGFCLASQGPGASTDMKVSDEDD